MNNLEYSNIVFDKNQNSYISTISHKNQNVLVKSPHMKFLNIDNNKVFTSFIIQDSKLFDELDDITTNYIIDNNLLGKNNNEKVKLFRKYTSSNPVFTLSENYKIYDKNKKELNTLPPNCEISMDLHLKQVLFEKKRIELLYEVRNIYIHNYLCQIITYAF